MHILDNIDAIVLDFCLPTIIGIFTFATPLILQAISRVDDKYDSTLLAKLFVKDRICKSFIYLGIVLLVSILLWILQLPRQVDFGRLNVWVESSASLLLLFVTAIIILMSCRVLYLTYVYYIPKKLLVRLQKQYKSHPNERIYFDGVAKILNYSIAKADEELARQTYSAIIDVLINVRASNEGNEVVYPDELYDAIFEANEKLLIRERKTLSYLDEGAMLSIFIDEVQGTQISAKTYHYMWLCIRQAVIHNNGNAIKLYWERAHQYANFKLDRIYPIYDKNLHVTNERDLKHQKSIKDKFIEFHYALGGLLMCHKMYDTLKYILSWSNNNPPKYVLVPSTLGEVVSKYMQVALKDGAVGYIYYESQYPFIGVRGVNASDIIRFWIKKYIAVLFLRQYTLRPNYIYEDTLQMPSIPDSMPAKYAWNENLDGLKQILQSIREDAELLKSLGYEQMINDQWFKQEGKSIPLDLIDSFKAEINADMKQTRKEQKISEDKLKEFYDSTKRILSPVFKQYESMFNAKIISHDYNVVSLGGSCQVMDKHAFVDDQAIAHVNADSVVAEHASWEFKQRSLNIFVRMKYLRYILKEQDVWTVVENISRMNNDLVIFSIGNYLNYLSHNEPKLRCVDERWSYNDISVIDIGSGMNDYLSQSLLIMRKKDVPCVVFNKIGDESISKYHLKEIDETYHIFASIIDVNATSEIKKELEDAKFPEADEKAIVCIDFNAQIRCKNSAKVMQLKIYSQFGDKEQPHKVSNVDYQWIIPD